MGGDYSRKRFDKDKRYSGVLMQQGRVQIDSDWNEGVAISDRRWRAETLDVIGKCGVPDETPDGFKIEIDGSGNLTIGRGRIYVHGFLSENFGGGLLEFDPVLEEERGTNALPFADQDEFPDAGDLDPEQGRHLVFVDVWRREITHLEDPEVVEQAVGVDTTTRLQTAWRVDLLQNVGSNVTCQSDDAEISGWSDRTRPSAGRLSTAEAAMAGDKGPCVIPPTGGYRGLENRLYRVEIHDGGGLGDATFKWSRDNGAVATAVTAIPSLDTLRVVRTQRDDVLRFSQGDWAEITDDWRELAGLPGIVRRVSTVDDGTRTITLDNDLPAGIFPTDGQHLTDPERHTRVRRWDQSGEIRDTDGNLLVDLDAPGADGVIPVPAAGTSIVIEDGVEIAFSLDSTIGSDYHTADYWSFATRTADASVEILDQAPPRGLHHHFCRLAVVDHDGEIFVGEPLDCRPGFPPLTEIPTGGETCCEVTVGDGQRSVGDFTDIQEAVDSLPDGGTVCILPGEYRIAEPIEITALGLTLRGCGRHSVVRSTGDEPAVTIERAMQTRLENLTLHASTDDATVVIRDSRSTKVIGCLVVNSVRPSGPGAGGNDDDSPAGGIPMERPAGRRGALGGRRRREIYDPPDTGPAFERRIHSERPDVPSKIIGIAIKATRCEVVDIRGCRIGGRLAVLLQADLVSILRNWMKGGGVWVADGSSRVSIESNKVFDGASPGVVLGGIPPGLKASNTATGVEGTTVVSNRISGMGGSGVTSVVRFGDDIGVGDIEDILIKDNRIEDCGLDGLDDRFDPHAVGGVVLRNGAAVTIADNEIIGSTDDDEGALGTGVFVHGCLGLEVSRNHITGFGAEGERRYRCVNFEKMKISSHYPNPLGREGLSMTMSDQQGNQAANNSVAKIGNFTGLRTNFVTEIVFDREVSTATITMAVFSRPASAVAYGEDGAELDKAATGTQAQNPHTLILTGRGIRRIRIAAPQAEGLLLKICVETAVVETASFQAGIAAWWVFGGEMLTGAPGGAVPAFDRALPAAVIHDNVVSCTRGPGLVAVGVGDMSICDNWLESKGLVTQLPVSGDDGPDGIDTLVQNSRTAVVLNLGQPADSVMYNARMMAEGYTMTHLPAPAHLRVFPSGRVLIHGNQTRLSLMDELAELFGFSVIALDDIAFQDNQLEVWAPNTSTTVNLLAWGATLRAACNRFTEIPNLALLSCGTVGNRFNNTIDNHGTHCILAGGGTVTNRDNHFALPGICRRLIGVIANDARIVRWNG